MVDKLDYRGLVFISSMPREVYATAPASLLWNLQNRRTLRCPRLGSGSLSNPQTKARSVAISIHSKGDCDQSWPFLLLSRQQNKDPAKAGPIRSGLGGLLRKTWFLCDGLPQQPDQDTPCYCPINGPDHDRGRD